MCHYAIIPSQNQYLLFDILKGWSDVTGWVAHGGASLGTKRTLPGSRMGLIASRLHEFGIQALLIIGGFEVRLFYTNLFLCKLKATYRATKQLYSFMKHVMTILLSGYQLL